MKPALHIVAEEALCRTRVCDISFRRNAEHEARCVLAIRRREHPAWSQHAVSVRMEAA